LINWLSSTLHKIRVILLMDDVTTVYARLIYQLIQLRSQLAA
jgi:hypothetical protein